MNCKEDYSSNCKIRDLDKENYPALETCRPTAPDKTCENYVSTPVPTNSQGPTINPTAMPTRAPTKSLSSPPTNTPSSTPTQKPSNFPTQVPTKAPSTKPTT